MKWRASGGLARWCLLTGGVYFIASGGLRSHGFTGGEFECEQAVAHLKSCCPSLEVTAIRCDFQAGCDADEYPLLRSEESKCIQNLSCSEIESRELCATVTSLAQEDAAFEPVEGGPEVFTHQPVCL